MSALRRAAVGLAAACLWFGQAVAAELAPQRPGVTDVYFIGFAPWGGQDVFLSEARGAASVVAGAYASPDRATILSNEAASGLTVADEKSLRAALVETSMVMDRKEDVVFLLITSHGSPRGVGMERDGEVTGFLTPTALRGALDASGVKNAVVVI